MKFIKFFAEDDKLGLGRPEPIKNKIPQWYRESESLIKTPDGSESAGIKKCMPFMDSLITGYTLVTPFDVYIGKKPDGSLDITWNGPESFMGFIDERPESLGSLMPRPAGHMKNHLVWKGHTNIKTPRGYSVLFTHPLNRFDLPFTTGSAIVDSDEFWGNGNIPFFLKEGFSGTIPAGTPICQLIPIKRETWKMIQNDTSQKGENERIGSIVRNDDTLYKRVMWHRKKYD